MLNKQNNQMASFFVKTVKTTLPLIMVSLLTSCTFFTGHIHDREVDELDNAMQASKRETVMDPALRKFGRMLESYNIPVTVIQAKNISNKTSEKGLPADLSVMLTSTVKKIDKRIVYVPYDPNYVLKESALRGRIKRVPPQIVICGGISEFDKDMIEKEREMEANGSWNGAELGGRLSTEGGISRIALDLSMLDYKNQVYFPGVLTSNSLLLRKSRLGWGIQASYMGNGGSFDYMHMEKQGKHNALRLLVEFSIIELLGKYYNLPYWKCIEGAVPDKNVETKLLADFRNQSEAGQILQVKEILFLHGYKGLDRSSGKLSDIEGHIFKQAFRENNSITISDLFVKLWMKLPLENARKRAIADNKARIDKVRNAKPAPSQVKEAAAEQKRIRNKEMKRKLAAYKKYIEIAEKKYSMGYCKESLREYKAAHRIFPEAKYPVERINRIESNLTQMKTNENEYRKVLAKADSLLETADNSGFRNKLYSNALEAYREALSYRPDAKYPRKQVARISEKLKKYEMVF